jgi:linoleoyl-CoA desaturase
MKDSAGMSYPRFVPLNKSLFFQTLQQRVNGYFKENRISRNANAEMVIKTVILLSAFIAPVLMLNLMHLNALAVWSLYLILAFALAGIGMSIMHDANHGAYSKNPRVNTLIGYSLNLIGGMVLNWKMQHNVLHHTYTNIYGFDDDIGDKGLVRLSPHSAPRKFYRFQYIYVFLIYSIMTLYWATAKDFVQYYQYRRRGVHRMTKKEGRKNVASMIALKLLFFSYMIVLPIVVQGYNPGLIIGGFVMMGMVSGLVLGLVFQLAHSVEEADFPLPNDKNIIENEWAIHQLSTTVDFARNNRLLSWYVGGLNFQVEHHLFPNICHVHYPAISEIVEATAKEFGVPYLCNPTIREAVGSHLHTIRKLGYVPELDIARM